MHAAEGWYVDPFHRHEARWISDGTPTALVRDGRAESQDPPPESGFSGDFEPLPDDETPHGGDLRRADEAENRDRAAGPGRRDVLDSFDGTGYPFVD